MKWIDAIKNKLILVVTIFIVIAVVITIKKSSINTTAKKTEEEAWDILYQDVIITALAPTINTAIEEYYKTLLTELPFYDSTSIKLSNTGLQEILKFEHLKDYPLPERYKHLYIQ